MPQTHQEEARGMTRQATFYWHNGRSLGHTYESAKLISAFLACTSRQDVKIAAITGAFHGLSTLPPDCDVMKVPGYRNYDDQQNYASAPVSNLSYDELIGLRGSLFREHVRAIPPDLLVVNHEIAGQHGELTKALSEIGPDTCAVLTWRGVLDGVERTHRKYLNPEALSFILGTYGEIHVNIDPDVFDLAHYYGFPADLADRLVYTGYSDLPGSVEPASCDRSETAVAAMGGGQASWPFWKVLIRALMRSPEFDEIVVLPGPYLESAQAEQLLAACREDPRITVRYDVQDIRPLLVDARLFLGAAGASTISEVLAARINAILVPRQIHEREQEIHASRLDELGLVRMMPKENWDEESVRATISEALEDPRPLREPPRMDGARTSAARLASLIGLKQSRVGS
ncbi:glycosyltransferase family protein [Streptomyces sp. BE230]|uniref:glycosyltransferase family protein n=1 Tax=Streptomyces sp. BE230 TaxID=3002526 RepID=UPI002ED3D202|nr:glycosyltransferase [Streptomyces sp. BE230]